MRIRDPRAEPDPLPRAADVGPGSAFEPVAAGTPVEPAAIEVVGPDPVTRRRERELRNWRFGPDSTGERHDHDVPAVGELERTVVVPHTWSRTEPDLVDHKGACWYARTVEVDPDHHSRLRFEGLEYAATVYADGRLLGGHEGGFTPAAFDLGTGTGAVEVAVRVDDPPEEGMLGSDALFAKKRKIQGVLEFHDSRPGGGMYGPNWTPMWATRWGTGGMTDRATLVRTDDVRLDATFVHALPGRLQVSWVLTNHRGGPCEVTLRGVLQSPDGQVLDDSVRVQATVPPGHSRIAIHAETADAERWVPTGGAPMSVSLYTLSTAVEADGRTSDAGRVRFGVRDISMPMTPTDQFQLSMDGRRTYVRGANYIPGVWMPELDEATFRRDLELAKEANLNSLGPHAHILPERFYDAADETGMLVYQDFPLNLAHDPDGEPLFDGGPEMGEASLLLAAEATYRLFNHPSLVYWCGHNEPAYELAEAFAGGEDPDIVRARELFEAAPDEEPLDDARVELWNRIDPTRPANKASGLGRHREVGDVHTYTGSLNADPTTDAADATTHHRSAAFLSEYGAWVPDFSAAERAVGAAGDWPPGSEAVADWEHRTHFLPANCLRAGRPERYPDFPTWAYGSQLWAGAFIKIATEAFRRRKWDPSAAHRYHLLVDHWGDAGAGVLDRHRTRQLHYWALRDANRPLLPVVEVTPNMRVLPGESVSLRTWVINDHPEELGRAQLRWSVGRLRSDEAFVVGVDDPQLESAFGRLVPSPGDLVVLPRARGQEIASGETTLDLAPDESATGALVEFTPPPEDEPVSYAITLTLDTGDETVSNWGAVVAAPDGWEPEPGLHPVPRFSISLQHEGPFRLVRRWTDETVAAGNAPGSIVLPDLVPDQYRFDGHDPFPVDLYGDVIADPDARTATSTGRLPWPFRP